LNKVDLFLKKMEDKDSGKIRKRIADVSLNEKQCGTFYT